PPTGGPQSRGHTIRGLAPRIFTAPDSGELLHRLDSHSVRALALAKREYLCDLDENLIPRELRGAKDLRESVFHHRQPGGSTRRSGAERRIGQRDQRRKNRMSDGRKR